MKVMFTMAGAFILSFEIAMICRSLGYPIWLTFVFAVLAPIAIGLLIVGCIK